MEEIGATILSICTSQCELNGTHSCAHAQKTIPLAPIHPFTKQMVSSLCPESLARSLSQLYSLVLCKRLIKCFLPSIKFYTHVIFSLFLSFSLHAFCGLAGASMNHGSFLKLSFCAFTYLSNNSLIS